MLKKVLKVNFVVNTVFWAFVGTGMYLNFLWSTYDPKEDSTQAWRKGVTCVNYGIDGWKKHISTGVELAKGIF